MDSRMVGRNGEVRSVDQGGNAYSRAQVHHPFADSAWSGGSFAILAELTIGVTGAIEHVLYLKNLRGTRDDHRLSALVIEGYEYSCDQALHIETTLNGSVYTSGGTPARVQATNTGMTPPSDVEILAIGGSVVTPLVLVNDPAKELQSFYPPANAVGEKLFRGALQLVSASTFSLGVIGTAGTNVRVTLYGRWGVAPQ